MTTGITPVNFGFKPPSPGNIPWGPQNSAITDATRSRPLQAEPNSRRFISTRVNTANITSKPSTKRSAWQRIGSSFRAFANAVRDLSIFH